MPFGGLRIDHIGEKKKQVAGFSQGVTCCLRLLDASLSTLHSYLVMAIVFVGSCIMPLQAEPPPAIHP